MYSLPGFFAPCYFIAKIHPYDETSLWWFTHFDS